MQLVVEVVDYAEPVVVRLCGELDIAVAHNVRESVKPYLTPGRTVVADLAGLSFVDSAGLACLVDCYKTARRSGSAFWVRGAHDEVAVVLKLTGLCDLLSRPHGA